MNRMHPQTLLLILLGSVPLVVAIAGVAAYLLMRGGYGVLVWAVLPFFGSLLVVAGISFFLSRAAGGRSRRDSAEGRRRGRDGV